MAIEQPENIHVLLIVIVYFQVQFFCDPDQTHAISSVKEIKSCVYQMKVVARVLCDYEGFLRPKASKHSTPHVHSYLIMVAWFICSFA